jgi:hypothetical protein
MDLIKQFMKIGGFKTPDELEAYGEENFFRDFPQAKKLAMGGTPEAFNMSMPADKFFSYGVPVPPTYYEEGGSLTNRMVYPQIQSADQFFSPVYSNSHNAYAKEGGNIEEFPQAVSYPQHGWGKTNYFMLQDGGTFPPGMPQYTGMLPVMQTGAANNGVLARTIDDNDHYGIKPMQDGGEQGASGGMPLSRSQKFIETIQKLALKPYMKDLQEKMQQGGFPTYSPQDEEMGEPGAKYGGYPLRRFQGDKGPSSVPGSGVLLPVVFKDANSDLLFKQLDQAANQNQAQTTSQQAAQQAVNQQAQQSQQSQQATANTDANTIANAKKMGWGNNVQGYIDSGYGWGPQHKEVRRTPRPKQQSVNQPKVTQNTNPVTSSEKKESSKTAPETTATAKTETTGTPSSTKSPMGDWIEATYKGQKGFVHPETHELYLPNQGQQENPYYQNYYPDYGYGYDPRSTYDYLPMDYIPGGMTRGRFDTRGQAEDFLYAATRGMLTPEHVKHVDFERDTRKALFKKNRTPYIKHVTFDLYGDTAKNPVSTLETEPTKTTQVPMIQDPGKPPAQNSVQAQVSQSSNPGVAIPKLSPEMYAAMNNAGVVNPNGPTQKGPILSASPYDVTEFSPEVLAAFDNSTIPQTDTITSLKPYGMTLLPNVGSQEAQLMPSSGMIPNSRTTSAPVTNFSSNPNIRKAQEAYNIQMGYVNGPTNNFEFDPETQYLQIGNQGPVKIPVGPVYRNGGLFALPGYQPGGSILDENPFGGTEVMVQQNPDMQTHWDTGVNDQMNEVARGLEKDSWKKQFGFTPAKPKKPKWGANSTMAAERVATNVLNRFLKGNWDTQDFTSAFSTHPMVYRENNRGNWETNSGMLRPDSYNYNMRGFAPPMPMGPIAQTGGQQFANMDGDQYYLTQEQINKVIKAGGRVPGF